MFFEGGEKILKFIITPCFITQNVYFGREEKEKVHKFPTDRLINDFVCTKRVSKTDCKF